MKKQILHLKEYKPLLVSSILLFIFLIPLVSSTAQFNPLPSQNLQTNSYGNIDLDNYCYSDNPSLICEYSSYGLQFENPDTGILTTILESGEHTNSYFTIRLISGLVQILTNDKVFSGVIIVFGADVPYSSQVSTSFALDIQENLKPIQTASFLPPDLNGNESITYYMNNFFLYHTSISASYSDDVLNQSIFLTRTTVGGQICSTGQIEVCLTGLGDDISLIIKGLNIGYNSTVTGGNLMYITAINSYGSTAGTPFPVLVTRSADNYSSSPYRRPLSIAPIIIEYNSSSGVTFCGEETTADLYSTYAMGYHDFSYFYGNYTYLTASFTLDSSLSDYTYNITYEYFNNGTYLYNRSDGPSGSVSYDSYVTYLRNITGSPPLIQVGFPEASFCGTGNEFYMNSFSFPFNITVYTKACNSQGCITVDDFGNLDKYLVRVEALLPEGVPLTIAPIILGYHETRITDINNFYSNFNYILTTWSETSQNMSLRTPNSGYNSTVYVLGTPIYEARLYFNNVFSVTSANSNHNFTINLEACNAIGCVNGTDGIPLTILFIIQDTALGVVSDIQTSDAWWRNIFNLFLGLFPDSDALNSMQKGSIVMITIGVIVTITMFFGFKSGGSILPLVYVSAGLSFFLFLFFIAKGYISPIVLVGLTVVSLGIIFLKYKGGNSS
jgi:hypothetical protein